MKPSVTFDWSYQCLVCMQVIWKSLKIREGLHWQNTENDTWEAKSDEQRTERAIKVDTQSERHSCQAAAGFPPAVRRGGRWGRRARWWAFLYPANLGSWPYRYEIQCCAKRNIDRSLLPSEFFRPPRLVSLATGCLKINDTAVQPEILDPLPSSVWLQTEFPQNLSRLISQYGTYHRSIRSICSTWYCFGSKFPWVRNQDGGHGTVMQTLTGVIVTICTM